MAHPVRCKFWIEWILPDAMMISDVGNGDCPSVTNDAEAVVAYLLGSQLLNPGMRLLYLDSEEHEDELLFDADGFKGFKILRDTSVLPGQSITGEQSPLAFAKADQEFPDASSGSDQELGAAEDR